MNRVITLCMFGVGFGFVLHRIGFGSVQEVQQMFLLQTARLPLTLCLAIGLLVPFYRIIRDKREPISHRITWRIVVGALLFGMGWALSAACPGTVLVQIGAGYIPGCAVLLGIICGVLLHQQAQRHWIPDETASCSD